MSDKLKKEELEIIGKLFDEVIGEYEKDSHIIFLNESERARKHFGRIKQGLKKWSKKQICMVPGCNKRSIVRSHTVPKGMSISVISENRHVLEPEFDHKLGKVVLKKIGIANATTFPGFCTDHELLFEEFENKKTIDTPPHLYLQAYRAACRELFRAESIVEQQEWVIKEYRDIREQGIFRLLLYRMRKCGLDSEIDFKSIDFKNEPLMLDALEKTQSARKHATYIRENILPALEKAVFFGDATDICISATSIDLEIPVALAGAASFAVDDAGVYTEVTLLMNVVPSVGNTLIIFAATNSNSRYLEYYKENWVNHGINILSMVESWMINGTDQWCLRPSVWERIDENRQAELMRMILSAEKGIIQHCELSIFDCLRESLIKQSNIVNGGNVSEKYNLFMAREGKKIPDKK